MGKVWEVSKFIAGEFIEHPFRTVASTAIGALIFKTIDEELIRRENAWHHKDMAQARQERAAMEAAEADMEREHA